MPEAPSCPNCSYSLAGLSSLACPECGYQLEPDELEGADRRAVFLALTRVSQFTWLVLAALLLILLSTSRRFGDVSAVWLLAGAAVIVAPGLFAGPALFLHRIPKAYRPHVRRLWRLSLPWLQLPWLLPAGLTIVAWICTTALDNLSLVEWRLFVEEWVMNPISFGFAILVGLILAPILWRWRWRDLVAVAGLPKRILALVRVRDAVFIALAPAAIAMAIIGAFLIMFYATLK